MSDEKKQTYFHKGARVINAAIRELDFPDGLKETAQQVVTLFATDLLPGLWMRQPDGAAPRSNASRPETPEEVEARLLERLKERINRFARDLDDDDVEAPKAAEDPTPQQDSPREPAWNSDAIKMVRTSYDLLLRTHEEHMQRVEGALVAAARRGVDPLDIHDALLHATGYCREDPTVTTLAALTDTTQRDVH